MIAFVSEGRTLEPVSSSPSAARRWLCERLGDYSAEFVDDAGLLVTEIVTNSVIHAQTRMHLVVLTSGRQVRVEVADEIPTLPSPKAYAVDAATGRGIKLLDGLAGAWGAEVVPGGKIVWFELVDGGEGDLPATIADGPVGRSVWQSDQSSGDVDGAGPADELLSIRLDGVPLRLLGCAAEQYDALFREFRLMAEPDEAEPLTLPARLVALADEVSSRYSSFTVATDALLAAALERGDDTIDLCYELPADVGSATAHYDELLDEADAWCQAGDLLTLAPPAEAVALRKWLLGEFVRQAAGHASASWSHSRWATGLVG